MCGSTAGSAAKRFAPAGGKKHAQACCMERHKKMVWVCDATRKHAIACPVMRYCRVVNHLKKTNSAQKKTISARYWPLWRQFVNATRQSLHVMSCHGDNLWTGKDDLQTGGTHYKTISAQMKTISARYWPLWRRSVNATRHSLHKVVKCEDNLCTRKDNLQTTKNGRRQALHSKSWYNKSVNTPVYR